MSFGDVMLSQDENAGPKAGSRSKGSRFVKSCFSLSNAGFFATSSSDAKAVALPSRELYQETAALFDE